MKLGVIGKLAAKGSTMLMKHGNMIISIGTGASILAAVVYTYKNAPKAKDVLERRKEALNELENHKKEISLEDYVYSKKEINKGAAKELVPIVLPTIIFTGMAFGGIAGINILNKRKQAALSAAYGAADLALTNYMDAVQETVGEKKFKEIEKKFDERLAGDVTIPSTTKPLDGEYWTVEPTSKHLVHMNDDKVEAVNQWISNQFKTWDTFVLNDLYDYINKLQKVQGVNIPLTTVGDSLGWSTAVPEDRTLSIYLGSGFDKDGHPCYVIHYTIQPHVIGGV